MFFLYQVIKLIFNSKKLVNKMTQLISEHNASFNFTDNFRGEHSCTVNIKVAHTKYEHDAKECYRISYDYSFPEGQVTGVENMAHPFYKKTDSRHDTTGVIVFKNEVTEKLVKFLLLPDEELSNFTGTTTPKAYRRLMMYSLDMLWD